MYFPALLDNVKDISSFYTPKQVVQKMVSSHDGQYRIQGLGPAQSHTANIFYHSLSILELGC